MEDPLGELGNRVDDIGEDEVMGAFLMASRSGGNAILCGSSLLMR